MLFLLGVQAAISHVGFFFYRTLSEMPEPLQLIAFGCAFLAVSELGKKVIHWEASKKADPKPAKPVEPSLPPVAALHSKQHDAGD